MSLSEKEKHMFRMIRRSQEAWWVEDITDSFDLEDMIEKELVELEASDNNPKGES